MRENVTPKYIFGFKMKAVIEVIKFDEQFQQLSGKYHRRFPIIFFKF